MSEPTIRDVAARAGVSRSAASRALLGLPEVSPASRERVLAAAADLGYVANAMAQGLVNKRTRTIGVFIRDASNPYYADLHAALQREAQGRGYRVIATTGNWIVSPDDEARALDVLVGLRVDGLVVCSSGLPVSHILPLAQRTRTVLVGRPERNEGLSAVFLDEEHGGRTIADHLFAQGHRRIVVVTAPAALSLSQQARSAAMKERFEERGGDAHAYVLTGGQDAEAIVDEAVSAEVTAIACPSNPLGADVLDELRRRRIAVPAQLSVTGYDTTGQLSHPLIGLTSLFQPVDEIARRAVDAVLADGPTRHESVHGELVPGRTTGAPRTGALSPQD